MNNFIYDIPTRVYFGKNQLEGNLGKELKKFGNKVLLTYGGGSIKKTGLYDRVIKELKDNKLEVFELNGIEPNPRIDSVRKGAEICKKEKIDVLLAVGGGSTIDATKYMAAGAMVDFDPWLFFSEGKKVEKALPVVSILTLAATGSEMDAAAVVSNPETKDKIGAASYHVIPKVSFLEPENTFSVSRYQTACGSADIISHILEVYFNMEPDLYMLDCFMEGLLKTVIKYAPVAMDDPHNYEARANIMWASSWAINGFAASGKNLDWSCHPMEHELSAFYDITHGLGLAILTPRWMEYCLNEETLPRYVQFGVNVFGINPDMEAMDIAKESIKRLSEFFFNTLELKSTFKEIGIDEEHFEIMAKKACGGNEIRGFIKLKPADVEKIYRMCL